MFEEVLDLAHGVVAMTNHSFHVRSQHHSWQYKDFLAAEGMCTSIPSSSYNLLSPGLKSDKSCMQVTFALPLSGRLHQQD